MSDLSSLLDTYRATAQTQREKGTYFEDLIVCYLRNEPKYRDLYETVWTYADWAREQDINAQDAGIDLVAQTRGTGEFHAIQCKLYDADYAMRKEDIDSFMTASGKTTFSHRLIFSTCLHWTHHAEEAIANQTIPVSRNDHGQDDVAQFLARGIAHDSPYRLHHIHLGFIADDQVKVRQPMLVLGLMDDLDGVDVAQSVGRVMRNAPGKKLGYVILPVVIPAGIEPHAALITCYLRNEPKYRDLYDSVWTYADWAREQGLNAQDAGVDLVARAREVLEKGKC